MRIRKDINANYKAVFFNNKTVRMRLDISKEISTPLYPEIEDVAINSKCLANCSYCYTSALKTGSNFENILDKIDNVWGILKEEDRPFQIAIGGAGEPTMHPEFVPFVEKVKSLGIVPNYTTNGMHLSESVLNATEEYCGGVAVSYHPHIKNIFHKAIDKLSKINTKLNIHVIIGDEQSLIDLKELYYQYKDVLDYIVILPYQAVGRGKEIETEKVWLELYEWINSVESKKFAFGALFYEWLLNHNIKLEMSIYEPEIYSGYRLMDDTFSILRKSSYNLEKK